MLVCLCTSQYILSWTKYISVYTFYIEVYHIIPLSESPWVSPWVTATSQWKSPRKSPRHSRGLSEDPNIYWDILSYTEIYSSLPSISQYIPLDLPTKPFTLWQFLCYGTTQYICSTSFWPNFHAMRQLQLYRLWPIYTQLYRDVQVVSFLRIPR